MNFFILVFFQLLVVLLGVMLGVAFFSLFERKLMGIIQYRKGPNKVSFVGVLQPMSDAVKLITKFNSGPLMSSSLNYLMMPLVFFVVSLMVWLSIPLKFGSVFFLQSGVLFVMFCFGVSIYMIIYLGWFSNSKYSLIGSVRSVVQSVSYEIVLSFVMIVFVIVCMSVDISIFIRFQSDVLFFIPMLFLVIPFLVSSLAEMNRSPFDLTEGESELVSGYCVEYGGIFYVLIFLSENSSILFFSVLFSVVFTGYMFFSFIFMVIFMVWIRASVPRIRFDKVMFLCWVNVLPLVLSFMFLVLLIV